MKETERGGYGAGISDHKNELILTIEGKSPQAQNSMFHEVEAVFVTLKVCLQKSMFRLWVFSDCEACVRCLQDKKYCFTDREMKSFGMITWKLVKKIRKLIADHFSGRGKFVRFFNAVREETYVADNCSKVYNEEGYLIREKSKGELTPMSEYLEQRYMDSDNQGFIRFKDGNDWFDRSQIRFKLLSFCLILNQYP